MYGELELHFDQLLGTLLAHFYRIKTGFESMQAAWNQNKWPILYTYEHLKQIQNFMKNSCFNKFCSREVKCS